MSRRASLCLTVACLVLLGALFASDAALGKTNLVPVSGRVVDADTGTPVAGALVGVYQSGLKAAKADSKGAFSVLGAPGEKRLLYYDGGHPLYASDSSTYRELRIRKAGIRGVVFRLRKGDIARGKVVDPAGKPVSGARILVSRADTVSVVTDAGGRFAIAVPHPAPPKGG